MVLIPEALLQRTYDRILSRSRRTPEGCLVWEGNKTPKGYGTIGYYVRGKKPKAYVHRVVWQYNYGEMADGLVTDHLCRNRGCVEISHLEAVTPRVNILRGESVVAKNARKTHCLRGHPFDGTQLNGRKCKSCDRERVRERRQTSHALKISALEGYLA
ncbi:MAG: HNH endonuclease [Planctomycetes bacterium]|nr:HNH endonuclease [Planctomycetota bacterium]